jgi:carbamoyl-phosphate synthase large subunit
MNDRDKAAAVPVVKEFIELGFSIIATDGTRRILREHDLDVELILKLHEGRPHVLDAIKNHKIQIIINTPSGEEAQTDARLIRRTALTYKIPTITTIAAAKATAAAIRSLQTTTLGVKVLQEYN